MVETKVKGSPQETTMFDMASVLPLLASILATASSQSLRARGQSAKQCEGSSDTCCEQLQLIPHVVVDVSVSSTPLGSHIPVFTSGVFFYCTSSGCEVSAS